MSVVSEFFVFVLFLYKNNSQYDNLKHFIMVVILKKYFKFSQNSQLYSKYFGWDRNVNSFEPWNGWLVRSILIMLLGLRIAVIAPTSGFANDQFADVLGRFTYV